MAILLSNCPVSRCFLKLSTFKNEMLFSIACTFFSLWTVLYKNGSLIIRGVLSSKINFQDDVISCPFSLSSRVFCHVKNSDILTKQSPLCTTKLGMLLLPVVAAEASYEGSLQIHGNYSSCSHDFSTWLVSPHYIICLVDY